MDELKNICVVICVNEKMTAQEKIKEITYGIEEEGIPWIIRYSDESRLEDLAHLASKDSQLDVGIGVDESAFAGLYHDKLPEGHLLFRQKLSYTLEEARSLGVNAARMVKGIPFRMGGGNG